MKFIILVKKSYKPDAVVKGLNLSIDFLEIFIRCCESETFHTCFNQQANNNSKHKPKRPEELRWTTRMCMGVACRVDFLSSPSPSIPECYFSNLFSRRKKACVRSTRRREKEAICSQSWFVVGVSWLLPPETSDCTDHSPQIVCFSITRRVEQ